MRGHAAGLALVLYFMFWFASALVGAGTFVNFFEEVVFHRHVSAWAIRAVDARDAVPHQHAVEPSEYKLEIPLTPTRGIEPIDQHARKCSRREYSIETGATLSWWQEALSGSCMISSSANTALSRWR